MTLKQVRTKNRKSTDKYLEEQIDNQSYNCRFEIGMRVCMRVLTGSLLKTTKKPAPTIVSSQNNADNQHLSA